MTPTYRHTQYNNFMIVVFGLALLVTAVAAIVTEFHFAALLAFLLLGASLLVFHSLTVQVDGERVRLHFGVGRPQRTIPLADIRDVCIVQHMPGDGWGIRPFRSGSGMRYRITGADMVELELSEGRVVHIGSDEPQVLATAIEDVLLAQRKRN